MKVSELFYALQGEGPFTGTPTIFIRLAGCNLHCKWCDTLDVWCKGNEMSSKELTTAVLELVDNEASLLNSRRVHIVITGGEPLLHEDGIVELLASIRAIALLTFFELETNGTLAPSVIYQFNHINCSPKLANSAENMDKRVVHSALSRLQKHPSVCFKFVVGSEYDWQEIQKDYSRWIDLEEAAVCLMPMATTAKELVENSRLVWELAEKHRVKVTTRLQTLTWGNLRGK